MIIDTAQCTTGALEPTSGAAITTIGRIAARPRFGEGLVHGPIAVIIHAITHLDTATRNAAIGIGGTGNIAVDGATDDHAGTTHTRAITGLTNPDPLP